MTADRRLATLTLFASVLLHLIIAASGSLFPWRVDPPIKPQSRRYVLRLRQPVPPPALPAAPATPAPTPRHEPPPRPQPVAPPEAPPLVAAPPHPLPTPVPDVPSTSVQPGPEAERVVPKKPRTVQPAPAAPVRPRRPVERLVPRQPAPTRRPERAKPQQAQSEVAQPPPPPVPPRQPETPAVSVPPPPQSQARLTPQPSAAPPGEDPLMVYLTRVSQALEREKRYPRIARRRAISGSVTLQFIILPDGRVINAKIAQSSGHAVLNQATLRALKRASPMPPFPPAIKERRLQVEVPIAYELNR